MKTKQIIFILLVMLVSCTPKSKGSSILAGQVCGKSCWNKITVGKTEEQEFLGAISTLPNVDQASVTIDNGPIDGSFYDEVIAFQYYRVIGDKNSLVTISARTRNKKIVFMTFQGDLGLTLQNVEDAIGEPVLVSSLWTFDGGINVHLINPVQGFEITSYFPSEKALISPDTIINNLSLFDPSLYQNFLESSLLTGDYPGFILYPWKGYGKIENLYWPPR